MAGESDSLLSNSPYTSLDNQLALSIYSTRAADNSFRKMDPGITGGTGMKRLFAVALGVVVFSLAGTTPAQDESKKIVGKWEITKSGSDLPNGTVIEFTKDGKLNVAIKLGDKEEKLTGSYKVEKTKLTVKLEAGGETHEEVVTITKLTDDVLIIEDKEKKVDEFKKKK